VPEDAQPCATLETVPERGGEHRSAPPGWIEALAAHGVAASAAELFFRRHHTALARRTRSGGRELALAFDATTGAELGEPATGSRRYIDLGSHLRLMSPDGRYVSVHTHPSDCAPSLADALLLFRAAPVQAVVVVGARGTWYALSRVGPLGSPDTLVAAYSSADATLRADRTPETAGMSSRAAACWRSHEVWLRIAARHGLRYTRVEVRSGW
jgi:hypothetical protein